jgi:penicillin-binding protein 2
VGDAAEPCLVAPEREGPAVVRRRRRKLAIRLTTADISKRKKNQKPTGSGGFLRRTRYVNPKPKKTKPQPERRPRTPRMRPKKTVGERLRPDDAAVPRPIVRLRVVGVLAVTLFALMLIRLWYLQVLDANAANRSITTNEVRSVPVQAPRGLILDRDGNIVVGDGVSEDITLSRIAAQEFPGVIENLALLAKEPTSEVTATLNNLIYSPYLPVPVIQGASPSEIAYVREHPKLFPGVSVSEESQRKYPYGELASQLLGYVDVINAQELKEFGKLGYNSNSEFGQAGVEAQYQSILRGTDGTQKLEVNAQGTVVGSLGQTTPKAGDDVVLNMDVGLQEEVETALQQQMKTDHETFDSKGNPPQYPPATDGAAVVLDPQTGAVLAMASFPTYSPAWWVGGISTAHYDYLTNKAQNEPLLDRAVDGTYAPGSTFKLATATAALQTGLISQYTTFNDPGSFKIPNCTGNCIYHDNDSEAQPGPIDLTTALTVSSDVFFYNVGYEFWNDYVQRGTYGPQPVQNVAAQYGYGQPTGIDLPSGSLAKVDSPGERIKEHEEDPKAFPYDSWTTGDNLEMAFGQGETVITPLEQAVAYSTFANGGTRYAPEVAAGVVSPTGKLVEKFEPKVMDRLNLASVSGPILAGLEGVINSSNPQGTAYQAFQGFPLNTFPLAGKTGTASVTGKEPTSWFVAFGPLPNPQYCVAVVIDQGGYGAEAAAPVVRDIFQYLIEHPVGPVRFGPPNTGGGVKSGGT